MDQVVDSRHYTQTRNGSDHHVFFECCNFTTINGEPRACSYRMRSDRHNANLKKGILHQCKFSKRTITLPDLLPTESSPKSQIWDRVAQFVGTHNVALETAASPDFRGLLEIAFQQGYHHGSQPRKEAVEAAFKAFCPVQKATVLRERIVRVAAQDRLYHEGLLSKFPYAALSMDAGHLRNTVI